MNLIIFGAPGAGKGTQSAKLVDQYGIKHISSGDLFRNAISNKTELGLRAKGFLDRGDLVPDDITIGMVKEVLQGLGSQGFILDGFPRTVKQAEALQIVLESVSKPIDLALFLIVDHKVLLSRLVGRRVCSKCGAVYHIDSKPPKVSGVCDLCGSPLVHRPDDQESVIANRLEKYQEFTAPLRSYYDNLNLSVEVRGDREEKLVFEEILRLSGKD